jgi:hypothetical protein
VLSASGFRTGWIKLGWKPRLARQQYTTRTLCPPRYTPP